VARTLLTLLLRTAFVVLVVAYAYKVFGIFAVVFGAPLLGALVARPLIDLFAEMGYAGKSAALAGVQGRWFSHKGQRIDVAEDDDDARWLLVSDVRKIVTGLPRDEVLGRQFGDRTGVVPDVEGFRIRADALNEYLLKSQDSAAVKFKVWLEREVLGGRHNPRAR
jgi:hypothetical protein